MGNFVGTTGTDNFVGFNVYNSFRFTPATLSEGDIVRGGNTADVLLLTGGGAIAPAAMSGVSGIERFQLASEGNAIVFQAVNATNLLRPALAVEGGAGDDLVDARALPDVALSLTMGGGNDIFYGSAGRDNFYVAGTELNGDTIAGGAGADTLNIAGSATLTAAKLANVSGIETLALTGPDVDITLDAAFGARNLGVVTIRFILSDKQHLSVDASAFTRSSSISVGGSLGVDTLRGGAGNDRFSMSGVLNGDVVAGGSGTDTLALQGGAVNASDFGNVTGVERLIVSGTVVLSDAVVRASDTHRLLASISYGSLDARGVTSFGTGIDLVADKGDIAFFGSTRADTIRTTVADLNGNDRFDAGLGMDTLTFADAGTVSSSAFDAVSGIEQVVLQAGGTYLTISNYAATRNAALLSVAGTAGDDYVDASQSVNAARAILVTAGSGNDSLFGGKGADVFRFATAQLTAADVIDGGTGPERDTLQLGDGGTIAVDALRYVTGIETITLGDATDLTLDDRLVGGSFTRGIRVYGSAGDDVVSAAQVGTASNYVVLSLGAGDDTLRGGAGRDYLNGGAGADRLTGGAGHDYFVFSAPFEAGVVDTITDFSVTDDTIQLAASAFAGLSVGALPAAAFATGGAGDVGDRIIYDGATGALSFDADGSGAGVAVQFAQVSTGLAITAADFVVI